MRRDDPPVLRPVAGEEIRVAAADLRHVAAEPQLREDLREGHARIAGQHVLQLLIGKLHLVIGEAVRLRRRREAALADVQRLGGERARALLLRHVVDPGIKVFVRHLRQGEGHADALPLFGLVLLHGLRIHHPDVKGVAHGDGLLLVALRFHRRVDLLRQRHALHPERRVRREHPRRGAHRHGHAVHRRGRREGRAVLLCSRLFALHRPVRRHGDHEGREGVGAEAPGALRRGVGRLEDLHVAVDDVPLLVPVQGHQGEDRLIRPIRFRRVTGDRHVVPSGGGDEVFPRSLLVRQVQDRPVRGIVAERLLHREAVEVELLGIRGLQIQFLLQGLPVRGLQGLILPFDQPLQLGRHGGFRPRLPLDGEGQAAVHGTDAELPVVLGVLLLLQGVGVRSVHRGLSRAVERELPLGGVGLFGARHRRQGDAQLLIPRGVRRDREGLQPRVLIALGRGTVKVRARGEVVDAVRADGQRQPRRVVNRHARNGLITDKAKRERIAAPLREGRAARENARQQEQYQHERR